MNVFLLLVMRGEGHVDAWKIAGVFESLELAKIEEEKIGEGTVHKIIKVQEVW